MFDDRLVFESPGKLPGQVKPTNIRHTHFSRNPKIAAFLKAYHFVKEFGEGFDRICREQEANGANVPSFRTDEFILKITVPKVAEKVAVNDERVNVNVTEKVNVNNGKVSEKVNVNRQGLIEKVIERAKMNGDKLTGNRMSPNGGEQSVTTEVDGKTHGHFKDSYGPPENLMDSQTPLFSRTTDLRWSFCAFHSWRC
jgi:ATP-dependent DNA helicase RecG